MSVVKSKRSQSKIEFEMIYFQVVDGVDNLVENQFYTDAETIQKNRWFVNARFQTLQKLTDDLLYRILFPIHIGEQRKGRKEIASDIWKDAEPQDIKYCLTFN